MKRVFLDANLLIAALDEQSTTSEHKRQEAKQRLAKLLSDESVVLFVSPLVRYELLRGIPWIDQKRYADLLTILSNFENLQINYDIAERATCMYRFDQYQSTQKQQEKNLEKRKFDVFHYATAESYELEIATADGDFAKLSKLHAEMISHEHHCQQY